MINLKVLSTAAAIALVLPMVVPSASVAQARNAEAVVAAAVPGAAVAVAAQHRRRRWL